MFRTWYLPCTMRQASCTRHHAPDHTHFPSCAEYLAVTHEKHVLRKSKPINGDRGKGGGMRFEGECTWTKRGDALHLISLWVAIIQRCPFRNASLSNDTRMLCKFSKILFGTKDLPCMARVRLADHASHLFKLLSLYTMKGLES